MLCKRIGKLDLNVPTFLKFDHDPTSRSLTLSIEDRAVKQQKEMWGALYPKQYPPKHTASNADH